MKHDIPLYVFVALTVLVCVLGAIAIWSACP